MQGQELHPHPSPTPTNLFGEWGPGHHGRPYFRGDGAGRGRQADPAVERSRDSPGGAGDRLLPALHAPAAGSAGAGSVTPGERRAGPGGVPPPPPPPWRGREPGAAPRGTCRGAWASLPGGVRSALRGPSPPSAFPGPRPTPSSSCGRLATPASRAASVPAPPGPTPPQRLPPGPQASRPPDARTWTPASPPPSPDRLPGPRLPVVTASLTAGQASRPPSWRRCGGGASRHGAGPRGRGGAGRGGPSAAPRPFPTPRARKTAARRGRPSTGPALSERPTCRERPGNLVPLSGSADPCLGYKLAERSGAFCIRTVPRRPRERNLC
ncbi:WW domain-binding protein 11 [Desmodus rotundus]|uniref:WW domain-binding protein 11 n=1 Tax=Desmodus rotundus TaxID=9430 RepID=UPI0023812F43|nr:basic proline-rich protein-like [Desmodus rotundus]